MLGLGDRENIGRDWQSFGSAIIKILKENRKCDLIVAGKNVQTETTLVILRSALRAMSESNSA